MRNKHIVALAGTYPEGTAQKLSSMLPKEKFIIKVVDRDDDYQQMTDAEIIILRIFKANEKIIKHNPNLKLILRWGVGYDSVDIKTAGEKNVFVGNTPGANAYAVSEMAVLLMLALGRKLVCHIDSLRDGIWSKNTFMETTFTLNNKVVGIVGGGNIGRQVAQKVQVFGATVQYFDVFRQPPEIEEKFNLKYVPFEELLKTSDIVSLHVPLTDENKYMIDAAQFDMMKDAAMLINVSRGGLVNESALIEAIKSQKILGAGIDCVEHEPLDADSPLLKEENIIITPHVGGGSADLADAIIPMLVEDILAWEESGKPKRIVNQEYLN